MTAIGGPFRARAFVCIDPALIRRTHARSVARLVIDHVGRAAA